MTATVAGPASSADASPSADEKAEAYAGAEKAYRDYSAALGAVRRQGGEGPAQAQQFTRRGGRAFVFTQNLAKLYRSKGWHTLSDPVIRSVTPRSVTPATSKAGAQVVLLACEDFSKAGIVDKSGKPAVEVAKGDSRLVRDTVHLVQTSQGAPWVVDYFEISEAKAC